MPLQARELVGTLNASPAEVGAELRSMERVYTNALAYIQFDVINGEGSVRLARTRIGPKVSAPYGNITSVSHRHRTGRRGCGCTPSGTRGR